MLKIAEIVKETQSEGPGKRLAIWVQGCNIKCKNCCNPQMIDFSGGYDLPLSDGIELLQQAKNVEGVTILGGEPFDQANDLLPLAEEAIRLNLGIIIFSGYTLKQLRLDNDISIHRLLDVVDLLIDGPYQHNKRSSKRRWIGSENQKIHHLSNRYINCLDFYSNEQTIDVSIQNGIITVNGWPSIADKLLDINVR